jgi:hypothetical protein
MHWIFLPKAAAIHDLTSADVLIRNNGSFAPFMFSCTKMGNLSEQLNDLRAQRVCSQEREQGINSLSKPFGAGICHQTYPLRTEPLFNWKFHL